MRAEKYNKRKRLSETMLTTTYNLSERDLEESTSDGPNTKLKGGGMDTICEQKDSELMV